MYENLAKYIFEGNPIKIFLSGARLRVVRSCDGDVPKVYGESGYLSEALLRAERSLIDGVSQESDYLAGSNNFESDLDKLLLLGTVMIQRIGDQVVVSVDNWKYELNLNNKSLDDILYLKY